MNSNRNIPEETLEDVKVNVKFKLAALWASLMFIYLYVDFFGLFTPGAVEEILEGRVWEFDITPVWALSALILMTVPSLMVFLSLALAAKVNRWANIIVAIVYIVVAIGTPIGETWGYIWFGSAVEIVLLALIVWNSWKWPKQA